MRYDMDYEWLSPNDGTPAVLVLTAQGEGAAEAVAAWVAAIPPQGCGGWAVRPGPRPGTAELISAGEDVADGIEAATDAAYAALHPQGLTLSWRQLPRN